jgi:hypothetical protein
MTVLPIITFPATLQVCVRAKEWLKVDAHCIPQRRRPVEGSPLDFRRPRLIGTMLLDCSPATRSPIGRDDARASRSSR